MNETQGSSSSSTFLDKPWQLCPIPVPFRALGRSSHLDWLLSSLPLSSLCAGSTLSCPSSANTGVTPWKLALMSVTCFQLKDTIQNPLKRKNS